MSEQHRPTVAILASGGGTTAAAFIRATQEGRVDAEVGLVICSKPPNRAGIYDRVNRLNRFFGTDIEIEEINGRTHPKGKNQRGQTYSESTAICQKISDGRFTLVAAMGYMRIIRGDLMTEYGWKPSHASIYQSRMINTHPGPLPATTDTWGVHASQRVLDLGLDESAHTVHLVAPKVDEGPILAAQPVEIHPGDTAQELFDRVQVTEKAALPYVLGNFLIEQAQYLALTA